jgi:parvulin-like peptidyl-prolyl isomerase
MRDEVHVRHILVKPSEIRTKPNQGTGAKLYDRIQNGEDFANWRRASRKTRALRSTAAT